MAQAMAALGIAKGDRVAFLSPSTIELVAAFHAVHKLGAVTLNLHGREAVGQHVAITKAVGVRLVLFADVYAETAHAIGRALGPAVRVIPLGAADTATRGGDGARAEVGPLPVAMDEDDPATILLSSGTTGLPKALLHTQRDVLTSCHGLMGTWSGIAPDDVFLNAFSPSFAVWLGHATAFLNHGAHVVLLPQWDPQRFLELIVQHRVTCTALTASMWRAVLRQSVERYDLSSIRLAYWLGERMPRERIEEVMARVTASFGCLYGLAEFIGGTGLTMIRADELRAGKWTSVGRPYLNTDLRIVPIGGPADQELAPGEAGEIILRGATLAERSLTDPEWRARRVRDGWLYTGDVGSRDGDGYRHLHSRADYMINSAGVKFSPEEIEAVLERHPEVAEAGVLGVRDEERGERVRAVVVPKAAGLAADTLDAWCRTQPILAPFKRPREYRFTDSLPRTVTGKLDRAALRRFANDPELPRSPQPPQWTETER